jgi:hypothetical protein
VRYSLGYSADYVRLRAKFRKLSKFWHNSEKLYHFHHPSADSIVPDHDPGDELFRDYEQK